MTKYLIDTNICIYYLKGKFNLNTKFESVGPENCLISEITLAELKFGVANSEKKDKNQKALDGFLSSIKIIPIISCLDFYATEKSRLRKAGIPVDDFDLLIGATAVAHNLILVTNNTSHFSRIEGVMLEDWSKEQ